MQRAGDILRGFVADRSRRDADSSSRRVLPEEEQTAWKHRFMACGRMETPGFRVTDDNREVFGDVFRWCMRLEGRLDPDKGLLLWGNIGTGKSTLLRTVRRFCQICRPVLPTGWPETFRMLNSIEICSAFSQRGYAAVEELAEVRGLAVDELGSETTPTGYYGTQENVVQYLLQRRYDLLWRGNVTHISTNLTPAQIGDVYGARIRDRCKEMFNVVELSGRTLRGV